MPCAWLREGNSDEVWLKKWLGQCGQAPAQFPSVPSDCGLCPSVVKFTALTTNVELCSLSEGSRIEYSGLQCGGYGDGRIQWNSMRNLDLGNGLTTAQCTWRRPGGDDPVYPIAESEKQSEDCSSTDILITSHRNMNLEDRVGNLGLHSDVGGWQKWNLIDAGDGTVLITSHRNKQLEDRDGRLGLSPDRGGLMYRKWKLVSDGGNKFFLVSHRDQKLEDRGGKLGLHSDSGGWQKWKIESVSGAVPCFTSSSNRRLSGSYVDQEERVGGAYVNAAPTPSPTPPPWSDLYMGRCGVAPFAVPLPATCGELTYAVPTTRRLSGSYIDQESMEDGAYSNPRRRTPKPTPWPTPGPTPKWSEFDTALVAHNGQYLDASLTTSVGIEDSKLWTQLNAGGGKVWLRSSKDTYLADDDGYVKLTESKGNSEKWWKDKAGFARGGQPKYYFRSHNNKYLSAPAGTYGCSICLTINLEKAGLNIKICVGFDNSCWIYTEIAAARVPPPQWATTTGVTITLTGYIKICVEPFSLNGWVKLQVSKGFCAREWWTLGFTLTWSIYGFLKFELIWKNNGSGVTLIGSAAVGIGGGIYQAQADGWDIFGVAGRRRSKCSCSRVKSNGQIDSCPSKASAGGQLTFTLKMWPCQKGKDATLTGTISFALYLNLFGIDIELPKVPDIQLFKTDLRKPFG